MNSAVVFSTLFATLASYFLIHEGDSKRLIITQLAQSKDRTSVRMRLREIGRVDENDYQDFRIRQSLLVTASTLVAFSVALSAGKSPSISFIFGGILGICSYALTERELTGLVKTHRVEIEAEFPAIIEMLTLALSAGETPITAMRRISLSASGHLAQEFSQVVRKVHGGEPFHIALDYMGRSMDSILIRRFVDALITAMLRGAPIIDVLARHALEARENQRNRILGAAAKAEISMMIPVVFLILPISILFALWPSLTNLNLFAG